MKRLLSIAVLIWIELNGFAQLTNVNVGTSANAGNGDPLRLSMQKLNWNDNYLLTHSASSTNVATLSTNVAAILTPLGGNYRIKNGNRFQIWNPSSTNWHDVFATGTYPAVQWALGPADTDGSTGATTAPSLRLIELAASGGYELTAITYDSSGVVTTATAKWPDGSAGTFTTVTKNSTWLAVDAWTLTHADSGETITQSAVTRNTSGAITAKPALTIAP